MILKWFLNILLFVTCIGLFSCQQNKKLEEDLGDKVVTEDYQKVVIESWGDTELTQMKKGDTASIDKLIGINNGALRPFYQKSMTITDVETKSDVTDFHLVIMSKESSDGGEAKLSTRERILSIKNDSPANSSGQASQKDAEDEIQTTPFENFLYVVKLCSYSFIECYKLKVENFTEDLPLAMKKRSCDGFPDCQWSGKKISIVIRMTSKDPQTGAEQKINNIISFKIVKNMPYLFRMVEYCFDGLSEYQNQKFPVKVCQFITDSQQGN